MQFDCIARTVTTIVDGDTEGLQDFSTNGISTFKAGGFRNGLGLGLKEELLPEASPGR